jgi:alcohol dehydrogenase, propanol-preferring
VGTIREFGVEGVSGDIRDFTDAQLDVIIDFAGFGTTTASAIEAIRHGGRIVQIGLARETATISTQALTMKEITLVGASNGEKSECDAILDLIAEGKIASKTVPITFDQIPEYIGKLGRGEVAGRAVALY